ncbi:hypothetical protein [Pseudonocardia acaciae]|uniref:hypothetical protein n=1 Tax=Pseudonocardia acaciae TaxID=551276 RepID=UPI000AE79295|nr:hypothetical protein [Pseudonocardia acaciae]
MSDPVSDQVSTPEPVDTQPPRRRLSVDWIAVLVAGVLVLAVGFGLLPVIPW